MTSERPSASREQVPVSDTRLEPPTGADSRQRALALGLEFAKRAFESPAPDDLFLLLTNDIRVLLEFDRSFLITHIEGESRLVAVGNQTGVEKKSELTQQVRKLAAHLKDVQKGLLIAGRTGTAALSDEDFPAPVTEALQSYMDFSGCSYLFCVPLNHHGMPMGHLVLEFFEARSPDQVGVLTLLNIAPFLAAALSDKWLWHKEPTLARSLINPQAQKAGIRGRLAAHRWKAALLLAGIMLLFFAIPFPFNVGGEAEVVPTIRHVAFCRIDGVLERVLVTEGSQVLADQVLAQMDARELDYKIRAAEAQFEILTDEMVLLRRAAGEEPSKLAESNLVELKRKSAWEDLQYFKWQKQFLAIRAPVSGIISTKDIESLSGKKLRAGEPFCEIAEPDSLSVEVYVPEDRITYIKPGQTVTLCLNNNPWRAHPLTVDEVAPIAEVMPRLGNVYRVKALFVNAPPTTMVGMKGTGHITAMNTSLWFIATNRLLTRLRQWSLYL